MTLLKNMFILLISLIREGFLMKDALKLSVSAVQNTGLAYCFGKIPVLSEVIVENLSDKKIYNLKLAVTSDGSFGLSAEFDIPEISAGESVRFSDFPMPDADVFTFGTEDRRFDIAVEVLHFGKVAVSETVFVNVCTFDTWLGLKYPKNILASFVLPEDPFVKEFFSDKIENSEAGFYKERKTFDDLKNLAETAYNALLSEKLAPLPCPSLFEKQRIRPFSEIFSEKNCTLLEAALIYLSVLEKCKVFGNLYFTEDKAVIKISKSRESLLVSVNAMLAGAPFEENTSVADRSVLKTGILCNLEKCRKNGILPLSSYDLYASPEKNVYENILSKRASDGRIKEGEYTVEASKSLRRAATLVKNGLSFVFDVPVFADSEKQLLFLVKCFLRYGKTASFLFETEKEKQDFEMSAASLFPQIAKSDSGTLLIKDVTGIFSENKELPKFENDLRVLSDEENKLSETVSVLKDKKYCGLSFSDAVALCDGLSYLKTPFRIPDDYIEGLSSEDIKEDILLCEKFAELTYKLKDDDFSDFEKAGFMSLSESAAAKIAPSLSARSDAADKLVRLTKLFSELLKAEINDYSAFESVISLSEIMLSDIYVPDTLTEYGRIYDIKDTVFRVSAAGRIRDDSEKYLCENFNREIFSFNAEAALKQWTDIEGKRSVLKNREYGKIRKAVSVFAFEPNKIKNEDVPEILQKLCEYRKNRDLVLTLGASVSPVFGQVWNRGYCDWNEFERCYEAACSLCDIAKKLFPRAEEKLRREFIENINSEHFRTKYSPLFKAGVAEFERLKENESHISEYTGYDFGAHYENKSLSDALEFLTVLPEQEEKIPVWSEKNAVKSFLEEKGLSSVVASIEENPDAYSDAGAFYMKSAALSVLSLCLKNNSKIIKYGKNFFRKKTDRLLFLRREFEKKETEEIFALAVARTERNADFEREYRFLKKEEESKTEISVSRLKKNCPAVYSLLFPVNAVLPSSVSQGDGRDFLVVCDRGNTDAERVNAAVKPFSSVICVADGAINGGDVFSFMIRSGFERVIYSLASENTNSDIALWAKKYIYGGALSVFPEFAHENRAFSAKGVSENGVNAGEIAEIYKYLTEIFAEKKKNITVKIAAFTEKQVKAIRFFIDKKMTVPENISLITENICSSFSDCDYLIVSSVFSGFESDMKYFSDAEDLVGGEERLLRYLLTAKKAVAAVSSLPGYCADTRPFTPGIRVFCRLFKYLSEKKNSLSAGSEEKIPQDIYADELDSNGRKYIRSEFIENLYIEKNTKNCILYDVSENIAADAETEKRLSDAGYTVLREFSSDRLSEIFLPAEKRAKSEKTEVSEPDTALTEDVISETDENPEFSRYEACDFDGVADMSENAAEFMASYNNPDIRRDILAVVKKESPVSLDVLSRRVLLHWGINRCGARLENKIASLSEKLAIHTEVCGPYRYYWNSAEERKTYSDFRIPDGGCRREITEISPEELANVYKYIAREYNLITVENAERVLIKILGFERVTDKVRKHLAEALFVAEKKGYLRTVRGKIVYGKSSVRKGADR